MIKRLLLVTVLLLLLICNISYAVDNGQALIEFDGTALNEDDYITNDIAYLPLRT